MTVESSATPSGTVQDVDQEDDDLGSAPTRSDGYQALAIDEVRPRFVLLSLINSRP